MLVTAAGMRPAADLLLGGDATACAAEQEDLCGSRHTRFNRERETQKVEKISFSDDSNCCYCCWAEMRELAPQRKQTCGV
jgi:hypothetical protein